ncbi:hypothetical protein V9T40_000936 [Parthenolecanium corni]|uniref:GTPase Era, mitochondrial n=1 Tax=Parthenolecanium corni TaxID=536013 RepID=A0AAN9TAH4_9HEMI
MFKKLLPLLNHDTYLWGSPIKKATCRFFSASSTAVEDSNSSNEKQDRKVLKVAIVGVPNAGKSTFINQIVGRNICAISRKVHTTRCCARAVINVDNTQLIFLDTPGVVSAKEGLKFRLEHSCLVDTENAMQEADVIGVLHDVSNQYTKFKLDPKILRLLYHYSQKHSFLILNKTDALKKRRDLLDCVRILTKQDDKSKHVQILNDDLNEISLQEMLSDEVGWAHFHDVFMVSGLTGDGVGDIQIYLTNLARPGQWIFSEELFTDQNEVKVIVDTIFSKLLDHVPYEVPYNVKIQIEYFDVADDGSISIIANLLARTERIRYFVVGEKGETIRKVAADAEQGLKQFYLNDVHIKLVVKKDSKFDSSKSSDEDDKEKLRRLS